MKRICEIAEALFVASVLIGIWLLIIYFITMRLPEMLTGREILGLGALSIVGVVVLVVLIDSIIPLVREFFGGNGVHKIALSSAGALGCVCNYQSDGSHEDKQDEEKVVIRKI